jgi:hypothetical protein
MTPPPDLVDKDALIATLLARIETLTAANGLLVARIAELESKLDQPPKTPDNSSVPPSKGQLPRMGDAERTAEAIELRKSGATFKMIGHHIGISAQSAHEMVTMGLEPAAKLRALV